MGDPYPACRIGESWVWVGCCRVSGRSAVPSRCFYLYSDVIESPASCQACRDMLGPWVRRIQITCLAMWSPLRARGGQMPPALYSPQVPPSHARHDGLFNKQDGTGALQSHSYSSTMNPANSFSAGTYESSTSPLSFAHSAPSPTPGIAH